MRGFDRIEVRGASSGRAFGPGRNRGVHGARRCAAAALVIGAGAAVPCAAQTWDINPPGTPGSIFLQSNGGYIRPLPPFGPPGSCESPQTASELIPGFQGSDFGAGIYSECGSLIATAPLRGRGLSRLTIDGQGQNALTIRFDGMSQALHSGLDGVGWGAGGAGAVTGCIINAAPVGVPPGVPVTLNFRWRMLVSNNYNPELITDDPAAASGFIQVGVFDPGPTLVATFTLAELELFNLINTPGVVGLFGQTGSIPLVGGQFISVIVDGTTTVGVANPGQGPLNNDLAFCAAQGQVELFLGPIPPAECNAVPTALFSLHVGSASELSTGGGAARFDPGDLYAAYGSSLPGARNGLLDDAAMFASDPPPAIGGPGAPLCTMGPPGPASLTFFDLDGSDNIDFSLAALVPPASPLPAPIPMFTSTCVHRPEFLAISYTDRGPGHYVGGPGACDIPTSATSFFGGTYGTTDGTDEVLGLSVLAAPAGVFGAAIPFWSESHLHASLAPNPDGAQAQDDDVDALDLVPAAGACGTRLFSADHGASLGLDPGAIYQAGAGAAALVISPTVHLGLPAGTDVGDFELVWAAPPGGGGLSLGVLFCVHRDDPLTAGDESGGLDPAMLYVSFLTGTSAPYLGAGLDDDIDAVSAWCARGPFPVPCYADCNADGSATIADFTCFQIRFLTGDPYADCNYSGTLTIGDFTCFQTAFGNGCP